LQIELAANRFELSNLCSFQGILAGRVIRAGICQGRIEKQLIKLVAEIVVMGDILLTSGLGIVIAQMAQEIQAARCHGDEAVCRVKFRHVANRRTDDGDYIGRRPIAIHISLAYANIIAQNCTSKKTLVMDYKFSL
jgi:hypothetical protein